MVSLALININLQFFTPSKNFNPLKLPYLLIFSHIKIFQISGKLHHTSIFEGIYLFLNSIFCGNIKKKGSFLKLFLEDFPISQCGGL